MPREDGAPGRWPVRARCLIIFDVVYSNFQHLKMEYLQNWRVVTHKLLGSRGLNPRELQGPARFAKWHLEIMKDLRLSVDQT